MAIGQYGTKATGSVAAAREALGAIGVQLPGSFGGAPPVRRQRDAVVRFERAGYRAAWTNEVVGKDALVQLGVLLAATQRMVFGTAVANLWVRPAPTLHAAAGLLSEAYPGRFVLGLGVGYPEQATSVGREFGSPLAAIRDYLAGPDGAATVPSVAYPRLVAANGPKMLALAGEVADGALPAGLPAAFTAAARRALGPDKLLVVGLTVVVGGDTVQARAAASMLLSMAWFRRSLNRLGYTERDVSEVSDRLVGDLVAHGDPAAIAAAVRTHRDAGADHVIVMLPVGGDYEAGVDTLERLAPTLTAVNPAPGTRTDGGLGADTNTSADTTTTEG